jgi:hypothetical protein
MAFLSQFLPMEEVAKLSDNHVDTLAEYAGFVFNQQALTNPELRAALEKALKPAATALIKRG